MTHPGVALVRLMFPWLLASGSFIVLFVLTPEELKVDVPFFGGFSIEATYKAKTTIRVIAVVVLFGLAALWHAQRSYAGYFPSFLRFDICFDQEGIRKSLTAFSAAELRSLDLESDWCTYHASYLAHLNGRLSNPREGKAKLARIEDDTIGDGEFHYEVNKIKGWQRYKMESASGKVQLEFPARDKYPSEELVVMFNLFAHGENIIDATAGDIFWRFTQILRQTYKQRVVMSPATTLHLANFQAPTKVRFFPKISISNTVYLVDRKSIEEKTGMPVSPNPRSMVPIGYAKYHLN